MGFEEPKEKWFNDLKESRKDFENVGNIVELAKFKYDRDLQTPKWVMGISLTILLAVGFSNILISDNAPEYLIFIAKSLVVVTILVMGWGIKKIIELVRIQQIAMSWLYREKDKHENERRKSKRNSSKNN